MENLKLTSEQIHTQLKLIPEWADIDELKINKTFKFTNFVEALSFINQVGSIAETAKHHPDIHIYYNQVVFELWTHDVQGLSDKDFDLAIKIEELYTNFIAEEKTQATDY